MYHINMHTCEHNNACGPINLSRLIINYKEVNRRYRTMGLSDQKQCTNLPVCACVS